MTKFKLLAVYKASERSWRHSPVKNPAAHAEVFFPDLALTMRGIQLLGSERRGWYLRLPSLLRNGLQTLRIGDKPMLAEMVKEIVAALPTAPELDLGEGEEAALQTVEGDIIAAFPGSDPIRKS
ncbi:hypothetical protein [Rhizobium mongolense]|uniref:Uncharacterized protein n=2 Tax=Rhizobium mongolense TaxID=57676 RepID=A0ABR6IVX5_9HYPH|nr:hypothetical protein [Rhizobium mongolense]MBB4232071.1 hypothetical protein [Rhizobium mongolense]TVZ63952.1 hypothetical protein BCL32_4142 [Rhizobium mongolense USDA 1844]